MSRRRTYGFSFSLKRALGISAAKNKIARFTGIPTTRSGRQRKIGRSLSSGGGCLILLLVGMMIGTLLLKNSITDSKQSSGSAFSWQALAQEHLSPMESMRKSITGSFTRVKVGIPSRGKGGHW